MSVFKKIKDVLFDIEDDEEETTYEKKSVVKESNPIKEVKMPVEVNDNDVVSEPPKKTNNFNFPLDFDDDLPTRSDKDSSVNKRNSYSQTNSNNSFFDDDYDVPRRNRDEYVVKEPERKKEQPRDYSKFLQQKKEEKKKIFTPSPVISPVYGVLNQNYTKDDVIIKTDTGVKGPSLEDVRKKAYEMKKEVENKKVEDEFAEPLKTLDEILISNQEIQKDKPLEDDILPDVSEEIAKEEVVSDNEEVEITTEIPKVEEKKSEIETKDGEDDTLEKDLFNLIDSMYENKDEEEE